MSAFGVEPEALGVLETETIHRGFETVDTMLKAARVEVLAADPIPPGRFLILIGGAVADVEVSFRRGEEEAGPLHDSLFLAQAAPGILRGLRSRGSSAPSGSDPAFDPATSQALGIYEVSSVSSALDAGDRALKGAGVRLVSLHLARGIRGGAFGVFQGRQDQVEAALALAEQRGRAHGRWIGATLLARPDPGISVRALEGRWGRLADTEIL